jgi:hypothetical protein
METLYEHRRASLKKLVEGYGHGGIVRVAESIGVDEGYLARTPYPPGKAGRKNIGESIALRLDQRYPGWAAASGNPSVNEPSPPIYGAITDDEALVIAALRKLPADQRALYSMLIQKDAALHQAVKRIPHGRAENRSDLPRTP